MSSVVTFSVTSALSEVTLTSLSPVMLTTCGNPARYGTSSSGVPFSSVAAEEMAAILARHGVKVQAQQDYVKEIDVGNWLVSRSFDLGADLIVMGAYGHSLVRERLFGGVTKSLLSQMTAPVLMEH